MIRSINVQLINSLSWNLILVNSLAEVITHVVTSLVTQLTVSGEPGTIYNGVADWLYEEEILGQSHTVYPARDGSKLAYISFNDTGVERHEMHKYGGNSGSLKFRYPKAGSVNPTATIFVQTLSKQGNIEPVKVQPPREVTAQ